MKLFCNHKWTVLSDTVTKSACEIAKESGVLKIDDAPDNFYARKHIQIVTCDKCGKIKRWSEDI